MLHKNISSYSCPECGGRLDKGYITGHWTRLRWCVEENTKTIFAGTPMRKERAWWNAPALEAARCAKCKIGIFVYDN